MNKQEIFDKVAVHLLTQQVQSRARKAPTLGTMCRYRGDNGTMCAVGCLIPDDHYREELEGKGVHEQEVRSLLVGVWVLDPEDADAFQLLRDLQIVHDTEEPQDWLDSLFHTANRFKLSDEALRPFA